jgi:channel protein (hemolysin III family)
VETAQELHHLPGFHEPFSAISHLLGAAVFAVLGVLLLRRGRGDSVRLVLLGVYAVSCVALLSLSGVYHMMVTGGSAHFVMGRLDQGAIFVFIAGTFTPLHGILFRGVLRWLPLAFVWTAAILGVVVQAVFPAEFAGWLGVSLYLALGWFGAFSGTVLARRYGWRFIRPLVWGGLAYSVGAVIHTLDALVVLPGVIHPHDVFHVAVLVGAYYHWRFIWDFATGAPSVSLSDHAHTDEPAPPRGTSS